MSCARFTVRPFPARAVPDLADRPGKEKQMTGSSTKQAGAPGVRSGTQLSSQGGTTMTDETISATTIINAPAEAIFAVLADPAKHAAVTSTGSFATTVKNAFRSNATARSVFRRHRPATNSRYRSTSRSPSR
jgi:hypothetical protein